MGNCFSNSPKNLSQLSLSEKNNLLKIFNNYSSIYITPKHYHSSICCVCWEETDFLSLYCNHKLCCECFFDPLMNKFNCPMCRRSMNIFNHYNSKYIILKLSDRKPNGRYYKLLLYFTDGIDILSLKYIKLSYYNSVFTNLTLDLLDDIISDYNNKKYSFIIYDLDVLPVYLLNKGLDKKNICTLLTS